MMFTKQSVLAIASVMAVTSSSFSTVTAASSGNHRNLSERIASLESTIEAHQELLQAQRDAIFHLTEQQEEQTQHSRHLQTTLQAGPCTPIFDPNEQQCIFSSTFKFDEGMIISGSVNGSDNNRRDNASLLIASDNNKDLSFVVEGESLFLDDVEMEENLIVQKDLEVDGKAEFKKLEL